MSRTNDICNATYGAVRDESYDAVLLPWGATEPHNFHLPYLTDSLLAHAVAVDASAMAYEQYGVRSMVLPPVSMGQQNPGQTRLKFCIHARYETQKAILADIAASLYGQGFRRLLIINGHGGNTFKPMIRDLALDYPDMFIAAGNWFAGHNLKEYFDEPGDHADEMETSAMLHYYPELVDLSAAGDGASRGFASRQLRDGTAWAPRDWSQTTICTGVGDPRAATAEKGMRFAKACAEAWVKLLRDICQKPLYEKCDLFPEKSENQ